MGTFLWTGHQGLAYWMSPTVAERTGQRVGWVYFAENEVVSPAEVTSRVSGYRTPVCGTLTPRDDSKHLSPTFWAG